MLANLQFIAGKCCTIAIVLKQGPGSQPKAVSQQERPGASSLRRSHADYAFFLRSGTIDVCLKHFTIREPQMKSQLGILMSHRPHLQAYCCQITRPMTEPSGGLTDDRPVQTAQKFHGPGVTRQSLYTLSSAGPVYISPFTMQVYFSFHYEFRPILYILELTFRAQA